MNDLRITKNVSDYPKDKQAKFQCPDSGDERSKKVRFLLGRLGENPLVVICMNPSAANKGKTDKTVSRIVNESARLGCNGWCIANVYPLRGTDSVDVSQLKFDDAAKKLAKENCDVIANFLREYNIKEVWGAWGNSKKGSALAEGKRMLLESLENWASRSSITERPPTRIIPVILAALAERTSTRVNSTTPSSSLVTNEKVGGWFGMIRYLQNGWLT